MTDENNSDIENNATTMTISADAPEGEQAVIMRTQIPTPVEPKLDTVVITISGSYI
jgi:hypothetical protein